MTQRNDLSSQNTVPPTDQLGIRPSVFSLLEGDEVHRVLFVGNSITRHGPKPEIGWQGDWGMAASSAEKDYVHLLHKRLRNRSPKAGAIIAQMAQWECAYWKGDSILKPYAEAIAIVPEIIVFRIGENVPSTSAVERPFLRYFADLVTFLNPNRQSKMIFTTTFWGSERVDEAIDSVAQSQNAPCVDLSSFGSQDNMKALGFFSHHGVAIHPGDMGMEAIANAIWAPLERMLEPFSAGSVSSSRL